MKDAFESAVLDPDRALPAQSTYSVRNDGDTSGPRALMLAILEDAALCIDRGDAAGTTGRREYWPPTPRTGFAPTRESGCLRSPASAMSSGSIPTRCASASWLATGMRSSEPVRHSSARRRQRHLPCTVDLSQLLAPQHPHPLCQVRLEESASIVAAFCHARHRQSRSAPRRNVHLPWIVHPQFVAPTSDGTTITFG